MKNASNIVWLTASALVLVMGLRANFCLLGICGDAVHTNGVVQTQGADCHGPVHQQAPASESEPERAPECCSDLVAVDSGWKSGSQFTLSVFYVSPPVVIGAFFAPRPTPVLVTELDLPPPSGVAPLYIRHQTLLN